MKKGFKVIRVFDCEMRSLYHHGLGDLSLLYRVGEFTHAKKGPIFLAPTLGHAQRINCFPNSKVLEVEYDPWIGATPMQIPHPRFAHYYTWGACPVLHHSMMAMASWVYASCVRVLRVVK